MIWLFYFIFKLGPSVVESLTVFEQENWRNVQAISPKSYGSCRKARYWGNRHIQSDSLTHLQHQHRRESCAVTIWNQCTTLLMFWLRWPPSRQTWYAPVIAWFIERKLSQRRGSTVVKTHCISRNSRIVTSQGCPWRLNSVGNIQTV